MVLGTRWVGGGPKNLCDTLSLMQAKKLHSGTLLQYSFKIFFHLPISQTCWKFSILLLFLYSPQSHRQQSLLPWDQRRETWVQQPRLYKTTTPGKWINSERQSEPSLFRRRSKCESQKAISLGCIVKRHKCEPSFCLARNGIKDMKVKHEPHGTLCMHDL